MIHQITIKAPFDAHVHLRKDEALRDVLIFTAQNCADAVAMGNLKIPVDNADLVRAYSNEIRIIAKSIGYPSFNPVMTIMLTPNTTIETIRHCATVAKVLKFIPANTSTNSGTGVALENIVEYYSVLKEVRNQGMIFSIHAEKILDDQNHEIPEAEREEAALPFVAKIINDLPGLKIIVEHVSTKEACELVLNSPGNVAATITAHHVWLNDTWLKDTYNKINPRFYCKPVLKDEKHRKFVEEMMLSGYNKFFFGSDSAPHPFDKKLNTDSPAAGIFSAPVAIELITEVFERAGMLNRLENFLSLFGRKFYNLETPKKNLVIYKNDQKTWKIPSSVGQDKIPVLLGGLATNWHVKKMIHCH